MRDSFLLLQDLFSLGFFVLKTNYPKF